MSISSYLMSAKAGALVATLWIVGVGARLAFEIYASNGGGPEIAHFSLADGIVPEAWAASLILMALAEVLGRNGVLAWRARASLGRQLQKVGIASAPGRWR